MGSSDPNFYEFTQDYSFTSPSAAASVIAARNTNGRAHWKHEASGQTYADWRDAQVEEAVTSGEQDVQPDGAFPCEPETSDPSSNI